MALALGLGALGVWGPGWLLRTVAADASTRAPARKVPLKYHKGRSFRIPFNIDEQGKARLKEIQLWVSEDFGFHWEPKSRTTPELGKFTFRTTHDGEFWFAVRTVSVDNTYAPPMDQTVEPSLKVVVDTVPPSLVLEPEPYGRRGSTAAVRWEVKDEHLDLKTLVLEYQVEGVREWRRVPIRRLSLLGAQSWDAGTADPLRVRASVADKAGNIAEAEIVLPEGTAAASDFAAIDPEMAAPPVEQMASSPGSPIAQGPGFPPVEENPAAGPGPAARSGPRRSFAKRTRGDENAASSPFPTAPDWDRNPGGGGGGNVRAFPSPASAPPAAAAPAFADPFSMAAPVGGVGVSNPGGGGPFSNPGGGGPFPPAASNPNAALHGTPAAENRTMLVPSPRFRLQYAVDDAGPNGPASVELWMTQDGGRTWIRRGEDPDRISPLEVDVGGEGTFGISLVARSASGLGDQPPAPGDAPQTWIEVDSTPPLVQLYPTQIGTGPHAGKVAITWRASDLHLAPRSVSLFWRPDQPGATWQPIAQGLDNVGQYVWTVPPSFPARFHIRVEAVDTVGHRGGAETTDTAPVIVDRSRPRSRIIGLDPNAHAGEGPTARQLR